MKKLIEAWFTSHFIFPTGMWIFLAWMGFRFQIELALGLLAWVVGCMIISCLTIFGGEYLMYLDRKAAKNEQ